MSGQVPCDLRTKEFATLGLLADELTAFEDALVGLQRWHPGAPIQSVVMGVFVVADVFD